MFPSFSLVCNFEEPNRFSFKVENRVSSNLGKQKDLFLDWEQKRIGESKILAVHQYCI